MERPFNSMIENVIYVLANRKETCTARMMADDLGVSQQDSLRGALRYMSEAGIVKKDDSGSPLFFSLTNGPYASPEEAVTTIYSKYKKIRLTGRTKVNPKRKKPDKIKSKKEPSNLPNITDREIAKNIYREGINVGKHLASQIPAELKITVAVNFGPIEFLFGFKR